MSSGGGENIAELAFGLTATSQGQASQGELRVRIEDDQPETRGTVNTIVSVDTNVLVVLDISTKTCGPCKMVYPHFVQLSKDNEDIVFLKMFGEVSQDTRDLMKSWGVRTVPQFHFWRNSEKVDQLTGSHPDELKKKVAEVAGK